MDLPGAPTELSSATLVTTGTPKPYCDVTGYVASDVQFELRLPVQGWSQRFVMAGCGGYCGFINLSLQAANGCPSVEAGDLAIASTDLGHESAATNKFADAMWAVDNPSAVVDFAYLGMHKVTLASKALIQQFYGQQPRYSYFDGCSDGGREALQEAQWTVRLN
jgi:feruloyl esterase